MNRRVLFILFFCFLGRAWADADLSATDTGDEQQQSAQESEAKGIIPEGGITTSTQPITPIALLPERNLYDQALEELSIAQDLFQKGKLEAASDVSLQAYDDLMAVSMPRRNKQKRKKLRADRHAAAAVCVDSSMAYIETYVERNGRSYHALEEGRARLGDLRDVSMNYPELNKKVTKALDQYSVIPSSPTPRAN